MAELQELAIQRLRAAHVAASVAGPRIEALCAAKSAAGEQEMPLSLIVHPKVAGLRPSPA